MLGNIFNGEEGMFAVTGDFGENPAMFHGIFKCIVIEVFQDTPEMAAVGLDDNAVIGEARYQFQVPFREFLFKLPIRLPDHFHQVELHHFQL